MSLLTRDRVGDSDRSSKEPVILYPSITESFDVHGLEYISAPGVKATEFKKGTSTDSSISSYIIFTAPSKEEGCGGVYVTGSDISLSRTSDGRLTSRGPFGAM